MNTSIPVNVYTEITPNPSAMKFVADQSLNTESAVEYKSAEEAKNCPLANELFNFPFIKEVFISTNYISIIKYDLIEWDEVVIEIREFIKKYIEKGNPIFSFTAPEEDSSPSNIRKNLTVIDKKIIAILKEHIQPAVEMDGGNIKFHSFNDGVVKLILQGACSGCPSSTLTLKAGIEQLLKKMLPDNIKEVVAING